MFCVTNDNDNNNDDDDYTTTTTTTNNNNDNNSNNDINISNDSNLDNYNTYNDNKLITSFFQHSCNEKENNFPWKWYVITRTNKRYTHLFDVKWL